MKMRDYCLCGFLLFIVHSCSFPTAAQTSPSVIPLCDVLRSPDKFDKQSIHIRGNVHLAFEKFTLDSEACPKQWPGIWLAFGGDAATPTMSIANDTTRPTGVIPKFDGVPVALDKDENFERFFALISARRGRDPLYQVTATLIGTFLTAFLKMWNCFQVWSRLENGQFSRGTVIVCVEVFPAASETERVVCRGFWPWFVRTK